MVFEINNRRYTGSKYKIQGWIRELVLKNCVNANSFCDIFSGTGVITKTFINDFTSFVINDFLYSNELIYNAFFGKEDYNMEILEIYKMKYKNINVDFINSNYVFQNYANKYFSENDSKLIGYIREDLEKNKNELNKREFSILVASLIYSFDKIANTVGHYDAFIKKEIKNDSFIFDLINPIIKNSKDARVIKIYREDANVIASTIKSDIVYIDPPYSSRQYSRFYHVIENIAKWEKPELYGEALKPIPENISEYSKINAKEAFKDLIDKLDSKYIVVSYNNTYSSKSSSSKNKMSLEVIEEVLKLKGNTKKHTINHQAFNAGKTNFNNHMEILFITKVGHFND